MTQKILVLGGAGYIGSACVHTLCERGKNVIVVDNLNSGQSAQVDSRATFIEEDILNTESLINIMLDNQVDVVMHFAAHKDPGESMRNPVKFSENITGMISVLNAMVASQTKKIIFSSSAGIYGNAPLPITENSDKNPINFYGETKLMCEKIIAWYHEIHNINFVNLRYFNAAGDIGLKYQEQNCNNIIPIILEVLNGSRNELQVFGDNYDTPDGTCTRDYSHLADLIDAHIKAITYNKSDSFNLGNGHGVSVLELINEFSTQSGKEIPYRIGDRRPGDPDALYADTTKAQRELNWAPTKTIHDIVSDALNVLT